MGGKKGKKGKKLVSGNPIEQAIAQNLLQRTGLDEGGDGEDSQQDSARTDTNSVAQTSEINEQKSSEI